MTLAKIVYTSITGDIEEATDIVAEAFEDLELEVEIDEYTQVDAADFEETDICVVATYAYGDGNSPNEIVDFYEDLQETDLSGKIFGVCGSGDTFYNDFCKPMDDFKTVFTQIGTKEGTDSVKVDLAVEENGIQRLEEFTKKLATAAE